MVVVQVAACPSGSMAMVYIYILLLPATRGNETLTYICMACVVRGTCSFGPTARGPTPNWRAYYISIDIAAGDSRVLSSIIIS